MKKLLSICFLSILLGLLSFSVSAQQGGNCAGGFWIENLQPDVVNQVANGGTAGQIALTHTLGNALRTDYGVYRGNAAYDKVEYYKLHLCSADICGDKKVSIDWELYWQNPETGVFERVNDNLSDYAEFSIYTLYKELTNTSGVHDFVRWLGGQVPDGNGFCNPMAQPGQYQFHPETATTPTNYPGALQAQYGCPECVLTIPGEEASAQGLTPLYTEALDYFYMAFLKQAETYVQIKWKNLGNYYLVMSIRERHDGTDWPNLHYDRDEHKYVGGHMSVCGDILYSDTIGFPVFDTLRQQVCEGSDPLVLGRPDAFTFDRTIPDTNIILGTNMLVGTDCAYLDIDTMLHVSYIVRHTPAITGSDKEICACTPIDASLFNLQKDKKDLANAIDTIIEWKNKNGIWSETFAYNNKSYERETPTNFESSDTVYTYIVRQRNVYEYYGEIDTCDGPAYTLTLTVKSLKIPTLVKNKETICREEIDENTQLIITSTPNPSECASSTLWYSNYIFTPNPRQGINTINDYLTRYPYDNWTSKLDTNSKIVFDGANQNVLSRNLMDYRPIVNKDTTIYFFAVTVNPDEEGCTSKHFAWFSFTIHKTPEIAVTQPKAINCPATVVDLKATITNNPKPEFTYYWGGDVDNAVSETTTTIGTGTSANNLPIDPEANYSYTQQIFTPAQVAATGNITKLSFQYFKSGGNLNQQNVKIYLTTSDNATFTSKDWFPVTENELVYNGALAATASGWIELPLAKEYAYDGTKNLVVVVEDLTSADKVNSGYFRSTQASGNVSLRYKGSNDYNGNPNSIPKSGSNSRTYDSYRSNIKFTVMPDVHSTPAPTVTEHFTIPTTARCNDSYTSTVFVKDGNGCYSEVDTFRFKVGVEHAPTISNVPTAPVIVYACKLDNTNTSANNTPAYETIADLVGAGMTITDDCGLNYLSLTHVDAAIVRGECGDTLVRTYTIKNLCDSTATFTQTFYSTDTTRPEFTNLLPIRLLPVRANDCKYNAPVKDSLVKAILPVLSDNCTEMTFDYVMNHSEFYWENSEQFHGMKVVGTEDIFGHQEGNQLTIRAYVYDKCGNEANAVILYINRPDSMIVVRPSVVSDIDLTQRPGICEDETFTLTFDPAQVIFPTDFTPAEPLTYEWLCDQTDVTFSAVNAITTVVTPQGADKTYTFRMHVTDALGCEAYSEPMGVIVKAKPRVAIMPIFDDGKQFPLCPTYGVLTIVAVDETTHTQIPNLGYTWSGESVNVEGSLTDTSSVYIIPDRCVETYHAKVNVVDLTFGCTANATLDVPVIDTVAPVYTGGVEEITVPVQSTATEKCFMAVPDFTHFLNNSNLIDNCQPFSKFDTIYQLPKAGTRITADTMVTIYVKTACDPTIYPIKNKFFARVPNDILTANVTAQPISGCDPTEFTFNASYTNNHGDVTFAWKKDNVTIPNAITNTLTQSNTVKNNADSTDYSYQVIVTDAEGCKATASTSVRVYKTITEIDTTVWPNTHCDAPWDGILQVNHAKKVNTYEIFMQNGNNPIHVVKNSEVPGIDDQVGETTHFFDFLPEGDGILTVTTPNGCSSSFPFHIGSQIDSVKIAADEVSKTDPTTCYNNNGTLTIHAVAGYTYEVRNANDSLLMAPYVDLADGDYYVTKSSNSTFCVSDPMKVTLKTYENTPKISFAVTDNSSCTEANGILYLTNANLNCTVTFGQETWNTTGVETISDLAAGTYNISAIDRNTGCPASDTTATIKDTVQYPALKITVHNNNWCANEGNLVNGSIAVAPATNSPAFTYTVTLAGEEVTNLNALAVGTYNIHAVTAEGCATDSTATIVDELYYPALGDTTLTANTICDPTIKPYDGAMEIFVTATGDNVVEANASSTYQWRLEMTDTGNDGWNGGKVTFAQTGKPTQTFTITSGSSLTKNVTLTCGIPVTITYISGNWSYENRFTLYDHNNELVWQKNFSNPVPSSITRTIPCATGGITPAAAVAEYIKDYKIVFAGDTSAAISADSKTYSNLNSGDYTFSFVSAYNCPSGQYTVNVPQYEYPALAMHATPNTMCVPTFTHPGNGTIVMDNPYRKSQRYDYSFYYANAQDTAGAQLQVNYFSMDNYTMYHLTDTLYFVNVYDREKGCNVHDTITVPRSDDHITATATTTANKNCKAPYDGTVTVVNPQALHGDNTANVDAVMRFCLMQNGEIAYPFQAGLEFTGVKDGTYTLVAMDTTTGCTFDVAAQVTVDKTENDFVINTVIGNNHSCEAALYDGTLTATATSVLYTDADFRYSLDVDDNYSETNHWTGLAGQHTVYVLDETSGCKRNFNNVVIPTENICAPIVTITPANNNSFNQDFGFCRYTQNATLTANATAHADCAQGEYEFVWIRDCHHDTIRSKTVNIETSAVMCCDYLLHVRSLATGCITDTTVHVCIQDMEPVEFISTTHTIDPVNGIVACQNDLINIGVKNPLNWTKIVWSHSHVTPSTVDYEPSFYQDARTLPTERINTFCVDVEDHLGCTARSQINLLTHDTSVVVTYDTACSGNNPWQITNTGTEPIDHLIVVTKPNANPYHCDSVYYHHHIILPEPQADFTKAAALVENHAPFCAPSNILSAVYDSVKVTVGELSLYKIVGLSRVPVDHTQPIGINGAGTYVLVVSNKYCIDKNYPFSIDMDTVPAINRLQVQTLYCASQNAEFKANASEFSKSRAGLTNSRTYAKMYFADNENITFGTPQQVNGRNQELTFNYVTRLADTIHKKVVIKVYNDCDFVTDTADFVVDTTYIRLTQDVTICENDTLNFAAILGDQLNHFENVTAYLEQRTPNSTSTWPYSRRTSVGLFWNNAKLYFKAESYCGVVTSDTIKIHIDSLPRIVVDNSTIYDFCLETAAQSIANLVEVYAADETAWIYKRYGLTNTFDTVTNVNDLVDSLYKMPRADVYFYAANGCDTISKFVGNIRILGTPQVEVNDVPVCPNAKFIDIKSNLGAHFTDTANYKLNELTIDFYGKVGNTYTLLNDNDVISTAAAAGTIRVIGHVKGNVLVPDCGSDTAYSTLTILTNDTTHPVMQPACLNSTLDQFIVDGKEPKWNGTATVTEQFWTVRMPNQTDSIVLDATAFVPVATTTATYTWITNCSDTIVTPNFNIHVYSMPTVAVNTLLNDTLYVCNNDTLVLSDRLTANTLDIDDDDLIRFVVEGDVDHIVNDTVWVLGGDTIKNGKIAVNTFKYNGAKLQVFVNTTCGAVTDSIVLMVDSVLPPVAIGDDYICLEGMVNVNVVNPNPTSQYQWYVIDGENNIKITDQPTDNTVVIFDTVATKADSMFINGNAVTRAADDLYYFYVVETNEHGCKSTDMTNVSVNQFPASDVITVKATNIPQFVFTYEGIETHHITELYTDSVTNYTWSINGDCPNDDLRLFVKYYIYKDGVLIPNAQIGDYFLPTNIQLGSSMHANPWISSNTVHWISTTDYNVSRTTYHYSTTPDGTTADDFMNGNLYPSANLLGQGAAANHDWWYLHFFNNRVIDAELVPFRQLGEYKIVYELWSTSNDNVTQFLYRDAPGAPNQYIGGDNGMVGQYVDLNLIVTDSLIFSVVNGVNDVPAAQPVVEPTVAPALAVEAVAPEMEVWPNPAPAITTTLKARVHHMAGEANVILTNLSGKQIYNGKMNIDSDNYYFEVGVNNLSVGTYIMTVRTQDAVITKKVVVTSLAR